MIRFSEKLKPHTGQDPKKKSYNTATILFSFSLSVPAVVTHFYSCWCLASHLILPNSGKLCSSSGSLDVGFHMLAEPWPIRRQEEVTYANVARLNTKKSPPARRKLSTTQECFYRNVTPALRQPARPPTSSQPELIQTRTVSPQIIWKICVKVKSQQHIYLCLIWGFKEKNTKKGQQDYQ